MPSEKFANLARTTLASAYSSGATTLVVASASGFPSDGTFRVRLGNVSETVWRVDSVSGTTWTGGAEFQDGDAAIGVTVKIVASKGAAERFLQSPSAGEIHAYGGVAGADRYGPVWKTGAVDTSVAAWVNQGSAVLTDSDGAALFEMPSTAGSNHRGKYFSAPATPYVVTAKIGFRAVVANFLNLGLAFRESSTSKIIIFGLAQNTGLKMNAAKYTNDTTFSAEVISGVISLAGELWLRLADNGTDTVYSWSMNGANWVTHLSEARGTFFTSTGFPNQFGIAGDNSNGATAYLSIQSLLVE